MTSEGRHGERLVSDATAAERGHATGESAGAPTAEARSRPEPAPASAVTASKGKVSVPSVASGQRPETPAAPLILAGDIGGTKANLALYDPGRPAENGRDAPLRLQGETYSSRRFQGLGPLVRHFLDKLEPAQRRRIAAACFGVAGPVSENRTRTPNLPWKIDGADLARELELPTVRLVNDLVATAEGIPGLLPEELSVLQEGKPPASPAPAALIAAGTGLGMAVLLPDENGWRPLPSEGGHIDFAPRTEEEVGLLRYLRAHYPAHVSVERVASGPALPMIYAFVVDERLAEPAFGVRELIRAFPAEAPWRISQSALAGLCPAALKTMRIFCNVLGATAGNLALITLARSGIYIGGGIAPKIIPLLEEGGFLAAFTAKGRFSRLLEQIPVRVIRNSESALIGAARLARRLVHANIG
jgi:glucokinase